MALWCSICNSQPADGTLTVILVDNIQEEIPACEACASDPKKVEFI